MKYNNINIYILLLYFINTSQLVWYKRIFNQEWKGDMFWLQNVQFFVIIISDLTLRYYGEFRRNKIKFKLQ